MGTNPVGGKRNKMEGPKFEQTNGGLGCRVGSNPLFVGSNTAKKKIGS